MLRAAFVVACIIVVASCYLATADHNPDWVQRGGALLTAISAFMAIYEAYIEHDLRIFEASKPNEADGELTGTSGASSRLLHRVRAAKFRFKHSGMSAAKLRTVFWISILAVFGEILHGFGDLIFDAAQPFAIVSISFAVAFIRSF